MPPDTNQPSTYSISNCIKDQKQLKIDQLFDELEACEQDREEISKYLSVKDNKSFIETYMQHSTGPTHHFGVEIDQVFNIKRSACKQNYRSDLNNKRLLFHGTQKYNVCSILRNGFSTSKVENGRIFGNGVYFSDCITLAANYASPFKEKTGISEPASGFVGYLFLCEVALGRQKTLPYSTSSAEQFIGEYNSVHGRGSYGSTRKTAEYTKQRVQLYPGPLKLFRKNELDYNEYIVYSTNQIWLKYLVKIRFWPKEHVFYIPVTPYQHESRLQNNQKRRHSLKQHQNQQNLSLTGFRDSRSNSF